MKSLILAILVSIVLPGTASAHDFQQSIEKVVGEYLFDVGYDAITFRAGDPVQFDFSLYKQEEDLGSAAIFSSEPPAFTDVWVEIAPQKLDLFASRFRSRAQSAAKQIAAQQPGLLFASSIHRSNIGVAGMTFAFPRGGIYELTVRFHNNDATLAKASFPLTVEEEATSASGGSGFYRGTLISGLVGLVIGFGFALTPFIRKR